MGQTIRTCRLLALGLAVAPVPALADTPGLAAYLRARVAETRDDPTRAAIDYARALETNADPVVAIRAYREALTAGDMALTTRSLTVLDSAGVPPEDAALFTAATAACDGNLAALEAATARLGKTRLILLAPSLRALADHARGDHLASEAPEADTTARRLAIETRALLLILGGRERDGVNAIRALGAGTGVDLRIAAARALAARGERDLARGLFTGNERAFGEALARDRTRLPRGFGVSWLFARVASDLLGGEPNPLSIAFTRAALVADPGNDRARVLLATALAKQGATGRALAVLMEVQARGPLAEAAAGARVAILDAAGRRPEALADARRLAERTDATRYDWQTYGDLLAATGDTAAAVPWYARVSQGEGATEWAAWMQYGGALETVGDWPGARAALRRAVELAPEEPLALNYLGYSGLQRGEDKTASRALLERAHRLAPDSASIADSLGWAYHLTGDTRRALPLLETAARGDANNAEVGEHLGDAYWKLGRRYEARYAWSAAALVADAKDKMRLAVKVERRP